MKQNQNITQCPELPGSREESNILPASQYSNPVIQAEVRFEGEAHLKFILRFFTQSRSQRKQLDRVRTDKTQLQRQWKSQEPQTEPQPPYISDASEFLPNLHDLTIQSSDDKQEESLLIQVIDEQNNTIPEDWRNNCWI